MARLDGKVCIVTGGTSGIGRRTAEVFVADALGAACDFVRTDVTDEAQIRALVEFTVARHGRVDCLFNNAGGPAPPGGIESIPVEGFDAAIATLLRSVLLGMKHVAPVMTRQRSGSIINNGSVAGLRAGLSSSLVYSAAKAAVIHLTRCVAMQLGEQGVRVNSISPGGIATGMFGKVAGLPTEKAEQTAAVAKAALAAMQPIPRAGLPEDIAQAAVFLAGEDSAFVNGHDFVVDGGLIGGQRWSQQQERLQALRAAMLAQAGSAG
jgi:NAD(P)-dependent dehydrogenase (short-subunit alcohol dehydrogenase family)